MTAYILALLQTYLIGTFVTWSPRWPMRLAQADWVERFVVLLTYLVCLYVSGEYVYAGCQ